MKVILETYSDPLLLGKFAGVCYGREGNDEKRLKHIISVGHLSVLRFGSAVFRISGISRVCLAQLTRSKHLDYLVRSSRYCDEGEAEYILPEGFDKLSMTSKIKIHSHNFQARDLYNELRADGMSKQDARYFLPQAQETELYMTGNYQALKDFIKLRSTPSAQAEVRQVALEVERLLQEIAPIIFGEVE